MEPIKNIIQFPFSLQMYGQESKVRGLYLTISCDIERLLCDLIAKCEIDNPNERNEFKLTLPFAMGAKIVRCKDALGEYNIEYFNFVEPDFKEIELLLKYRNMLAHGFSEYDDNKFDNSFIIFNWIEKDINNKRVHQTEKIMVMPFIMKMKEYRNNVWKFMQLHHRLTEERGEE